MSEGKYEVGYRKPPKHTRFSSDNQPEISGGYASGYKHIRASLWKILKRISEEHGYEETLDIVAEKLINMALGDKYNNRNVPFDKRLSAIKEILDRLEGRPGQKVEVQETKVIANLEWIGHFPFQDAEVVTEEE